jgi:hypothetical protein
VLSDVIFIDLKKGIDKLQFNIPSIIRGEAPMRQFHTASVIENMMFVFGGGDGKYWLNDLLIFDLRMEWACLDPRNRASRKTATLCNYF